ncbi:MFS transporter [Nonomuraea sediminis]|uniref:MFS transporter n=1 Tax=Nonomuraea sediminis TaxID=2835864 RepID=UPI001BDCC4D6|nr:MFS transporter [Nonomuraea sediminis]
MSKNQWWAAGLAVAAVGWGAQQFAPLLIMYQTRLDLSATTIQATFGMYVLGLIPGLLLGGPVSDRYGRRRIMIPTLLTSLVATTLLILGGTAAPWLFAGRLVAGVASGAAFSSGAAWIKELSPNPTDGPRRITIAMTIGFGLGPLAAGTLAQWSPWPTTLPYLPHLAITLIALPLALAAPHTSITTPATPSTPTPSDASAPTPCSASTITNSSPAASATTAPVTTATTTPTAPSTAATATPTPSAAVSATTPTAPATGANHDPVGGAARALGHPRPVSEADHRPNRTAGHRPAAEAVRGGQRLRESQARVPVTHLGGDQETASRPWRVPEVRSRRFLTVVAPLAPWVFGSASIALAYLPGLVKDQLPGHVLIFSAAVTVLTAGAGIAVQPLARRLTHPRLLTTVMGTITTGLLIGAAAAATLNPLLVVLAALVLGAGYGTCQLYGLIEVQRLAHPTRLAALTAVYQALSYLGFVAPYPLAALTRSIPAPWLLLATAALATLTWTWTTHHTPALHSEGGPTGL